jgi:hypothetical protein
VTPSTQPESSTPQSPGFRAKLWCYECWSSLEYGEDDLLRFATSLAWPKCCGVTMSLVPPKGRPNRPHRPEAADLN